MKNRNCGLAVWALVAAAVVTSGCESESDRGWPPSEATAATESMAADEESGETVSDEAEPDGGSTELGDSEAGDVAPQPPEVCGNDIDDDGDGLTDCDDIPDCNHLEECLDPVPCPDPGSGFVACQQPCCPLDPDCAKNCGEQCANGKDDNFDGATDCDDELCEFHPACMAPGCGRYQFCLVEQGCDCNVGAGTCPADGSGCELNCLNNEACAASCRSQASAELGEIFVSYDECVSRSCPGSQSNGGCVLQSCTSEAAACFGAGDLVLCTDYAACLADCDSSSIFGNCESVCTSKMSPAALEDLYHWQTCRALTCDSSDEVCNGLAAATACAPPSIAGTCISAPSPGDEPCGDVLACALACSADELVGCTSACAAQAAPGAIDALATAFSCLLEACSTGLRPVTANCLQSAAEGECSLSISECDGADAP